MKRVKSNNKGNAKRMLSDKQIKRLQEKAATEASRNALILSVAVMADELNLTDEQIGNVAKEYLRYIEHIENNRLRVNEVIDIIGKQTGIKFNKF